MAKKEKSFNKHRKDKKNIYFQIYKQFLVSFSFQST